MKLDSTKLTSVKILKHNYADFKKRIFNVNTTLQKFVNRAIDLYLKDEDFRNKIDKHEINNVKNTKY